VCVYHKLSLQGQWDNIPPPMAVWLAADLRPSMDGSTVHTPAVAGGSYSLGQLHAWDSYSLGQLRPGTDRRRQAERRIVVSLNDLLPPWRGITSNSTSNILRYSTTPSINNSLKHLHTSNHTCIFIPPVTPVLSIYLYIFTTPTTLQVIAYICGLMKTMDF